jgi:hypothetical protein
VSALRRTLASLAAWTLGAGVAVVVGILALSLIDDGLAAGQPVPGLAAPPPRAADDTSASPVAGSPSASAPAAASRQMTTPGGTATARCTSNSAYLASWSPAQGYEVDKVHRGPTMGTAYVAFRSGTKRVVLAVRCVDGVQQQLVGWHEDDGPGDD